MALAVMQGDALGLAEGVARRMCHDFAGLLGTLDGLTALAAEDAEAAALAVETAGRLAARVRLLRGAWGGGVEALDAAALLALAHGLPGGERLRVVCAHVAGAVEGDAARLCLCLMLVGAQAMPRGGTLHVGAAADEVWVALAGAGAAWPAAALRAGGPAVEEGPLAVPAVLCGLLAARLGWRLWVDGLRATLRQG
jgi:histidine phosphotransferase ChpT